MLYMKKLDLLHYNDLEPKSGYIRIELKDDLDRYGGVLGD